MKPERRANLLNLLALQLGAAGPLVLAAVGHRGIGIALAWAAVVLAWVLSRRRVPDTKLLVLGGLLGTAVETGLGLAGWMHFTHPQLPLPFPGWLPPSWALLGMATAYVLAPLRGRAIVAAVVGSGVGALGLYGAVAARELMLDDPWHGLGTSVALGLAVAAVAVLAPRVDPTAER